jgi:hypothetical protein
MRQMSQAPDYRTGKRHEQNRRKADVRQNDKKFSSRGVSSELVTALDTYILDD